ncbi:MAG: alpha/beta hydrolase [Candidatus Pacebacteria bacterium]|nr:alpha/beta hydrolase [Candidatus Paceibacterota bacterium]
MREQVIAIHGGDAYATYEEYLSSLLGKVVNLEWLHFRDWKNSLEESLGSGFEVVLPRMPNAQNAKYAEWKIWFEKLIPHIQDGVILVGHSLGGSFLAKYLSENIFPKKVKATFLVAAPFDMDSGRELVEFNIVSSLDLLREQGGKIFLYHSKDDPVVAFTELAKYQQQLQEATTRVFEDRKHFNQDQFPELVQDIKSL